MGYWSMVAAGGPVVGVVAGGPIVQAFGWRWIFVAQVPLTLATLLLAAAILPANEPADDTDEPVGFDVMGAVTLGIGTTALLLAVNRGPLWGWTHPFVLTGFVLAPLMAVAFVAAERRAAHPLLPLGYLRRRNFSFPLLTQLCTNFAYMGGFVITPLLLQDEFGYDETKTGTLLIARPIVFAIAGPVAGYLTVRVGERSSAVFGAITITCSMFALASLAPGDSDAVVVGALALSGLGMGASAPAMAAAIANAVDERDLGIAGATQQMVNQVGVVIGIQVMQTVQAARSGTVGAVAAYGDAYLVGAAVAFLGLIFATFVRSTPREPAEVRGVVDGAGLPTVAGSPAATR